MIQSVDDLAQSTSELPPEQRFTLAQRILASVGPQEDEDTGIESAWAAEIRERIKRYDSGETKTIPASEVLVDLNRHLARRG